MSTYKYMTEIDIDIPFFELVALAAVGVFSVNASSTDLSLLASLLDDADAGVLPTSGQLSSSFDEASSSFAFTPALLAPLLSKPPALSFLGVFCGVLIMNGSSSGPKGGKGPFIKIVVEFKSELGFRVGSD
jgi:hypothetical protein